MLLSLRLLGRVVVKDWRLFLADRRAAALCFLVPIILASSFGLIFDRPGKRMGETRLPLLIVVENDDEISQQLVKALLECEHLDARRVDRATALAELDRHGSGVAVVIPQGLDKIEPLDSQSRSKPVVEILRHPVSTMESQWAEGVVTEVVMKETARSLVLRLGLHPPAGFERPFEVSHQTVPAETDRPFNAYSHSFSGMTLQYLLFWGMESGLLLLRERQRGIWRRMRVAPVPLTILLLGRGLATASIGLLQVLSTFLVGNILFGVSIDGSFPAFLGLALLVSLLAAGLGLLVAAFGCTEARARQLFIVVILGISMLGGLWLPAFLLPSWVRDSAMVLPTTWAMQGFNALTWQGRSFAEVLPILAIVAGFAACFMVVALASFHFTEKRLRRGEIL